MGKSIELSLARFEIESSETKTIKNIQEVEVEVVLGVGE